MKNIYKLVIILFIANLCLLSGCKKDEVQPETERIKGLLTSGNWQIQSVLVNNTDQTASFAGLELSFTDTGYSTTNGGAVWPASGTWTFVNESSTKIVRNDGLEITLIEVTQTTLKLSLVNPTSTIGTGRLSSVAGEHQFNFTRN